MTATIMFVSWKAVYLVFLLPGRVLDKPLTYAIGKASAASLALISPSAHYNAIPGMHPKEADMEALEPVMAIRSNDTIVLTVADACNGLELLVLYTGLILCLPSIRRRKLLYIAGGIAGIEALNILRCDALALLFRFRPDWVDFSHHYLFTFVVYAFIFWLWFLFARDPEFGKRLQLDATQR